MSKLAKSVTLVAMLAGFAMAAAAQAKSDEYGKTINCGLLEGASVVATDGTYLGSIAGQYAAGSIYSGGGSYGSRYSTTSIWNPQSNYGNSYGQMSAFNNSASDPPALVKYGRVLGYLTVGSGKYPAYDPVVLGIQCFKVYARRN